MKIAILHYHFDPGGVTRVVSSTVKAFSKYPEYEFGILSGRPVKNFDTPTAVLPTLNYSTKESAGPDPDSLYREVIGQARNLFNGSDPDIWHIHNPALGKNTAFCGLVSRLAREGRAMLLHEHDFAEDFRPSNFLLRESNRDTSDHPFPYSRRIRFAVLNERDAGILTHSGLPPENLIRLPNPILEVEELPPPNPNSDLILYPVRALARKNLGEFLLLAQTSNHDLRWESTLPPTNPSYQPRFEEWSALARELSLPARLGVAALEKQSFEERLASSRAVVTTSVAEGFGLSFLEPWIHNRPVFGRDLPEITHEFRSLGVPMDSFYKSFLIPSDAVDTNEVSQVWQSGLESACKDFGVDVPRALLTRKAEQLRRAEFVDFSLLSENLQMKALRTIVRRKAPIRPPVSPPVVDPDVLQAARMTILSAFSPEAYVDTLKETYASLVNAEADSISHLDPKKILKQFLDPSRFHPHFVE